MMNIYIDLSFLLQILLGYTSLFFTKTLLVTKSKIIYEGLFSILIGFCILLVYVHLFLSVIIYFIYVSVFLALIFKKNYFKSLFLYLFCYSLLTFIIDKLSIYNKCYNFILVINSPEGIISYLFAPLFLIGLVISTKIVDSLYHLHNYKINCFLLKNGKKVHYLGYFDTGNTLKYNEVPVIFISKNKYPFEIEKEKNIVIEGISGKKNGMIQSCLLSLEDKKDAYFVYVVIVDKNDFNGCEILLNAFLK